LWLIFFDDLPRNAQIVVSSEISITIWLVSRTPKQLKPLNLGKKEGRL